MYPPKLLIYSNLITSSVYNLKLKQLILPLGEKINYDIFVMDSGKWKPFYL